MKSPIPIHLLIREKLSILFNSEKQLINYLQVIKNKSQSPRLQSLLSELIETALSRLSQLNHVFSHLEIQKQGITCEAINGLIRENLLLISHSSTPQIKEYMIVNFLQQENRYKITAYTWLLVYIPKRSQLLPAISMLHEILDEEKNISRQIAEAENSLLHDKYTHEQLVSF